MEKVLIAGASGYLGGFLVTELKKRGKLVRVLVRSETQARKFRPLVDEVFLGQVTDPETLKGVAAGMDAVYSTVGITRQKDGLTYEDVDYRGNLNLLHEALEAKVEHFLYVSVLHADTMRHLRIIDAKERFVDELIEAPIKHTIMRPTGFFSDMLEFLEMARKGRVYLFGDGNLKGNPISGPDLAVVCCDSAEQGLVEVEAGGPEILTHNQIAETAFAALGKPTRITRLPLWIIKATVAALRLLTPVTVYGSIEFLMTAMTIPFVADRYGKDTLGAFYRGAA